LVKVNDDCGILETTTPRPTEASTTTTTTQLIGLDHQQSQSQSQPRINLRKTNNDDEMGSTSTTTTTTTTGSKSIEEQYSRKTPLEHVLLRPGMYVGPTELLLAQNCWVLHPTPLVPQRPSDQQKQQQPIQPSDEDRNDSILGTSVSVVEDIPLLRPTTTSTTTMTMTGLTDLPTKFTMVQREYSLIPALIKIFDEILVNATDNQLRHPDSCTKLYVDIDPGYVPVVGEGGKHNDDDDDDTIAYVTTGTTIDQSSQSSSSSSLLNNTDCNRVPPQIRIWNNGKGIPIQIHTEEGMYVPELLFGHLLTGSNFDDTEKRLTGGRHGYGAKLSNIFSKAFTVETVDAKKKLRYRQTWYNNMTEAGKPQIETLNNHDDNQSVVLEDYTCITFIPDIQRLSGDPSMHVVDEQNYAIMCRRVVDAAGCAAGKLQVFLNGVDVSMDAFSDYTQLYRHDESSKMCFTTIGSRWEVGVGLSDTHSFDSISFVNGMATIRGGTHVNVIVNQVVRKIHEKATKIDPTLSGMLTQSLIRRNLFVSCHALIENPTFDSQMKEYLTSNPTTFGSSYTLSDKFLNDLVQSTIDGGPGIVEEVIRVAKGNQQADLFKQVGGKKSKRQLLAISKLEDAHDAGSVHKSSDCTLILTEGDSAKALAVAGLEVIGRDKFGVFPLRGKFLNVRHATVKQLANNEEVKSLIAILGLDFDKVYDTYNERKELRYGHVMLMTDQDNDGSHIKGLVINFFRHFWPKLLIQAVDEPFEQPFLSSFVTPLLKATRKGSKKSIPFYSMADYNAWRNALSESSASDNIGNWKIKYYKGLGTSTPAEAKEYFAEYDKHHRPFDWNSDVDGELLDKVFDKSRAADRRDWILNEYDVESSLTFDSDGIQNVSYEDFVNKELIHFSHADNVRSLPNAIDGLKPSQRKVLFACFKRKLKSEIKVAQLSGYCAEHSAYHHGEASLQGTIIGMAQDFVGSNNVNLLVPSGQFGTRLTGGDDAASPRYIFTHLSPVTRYLFPEADDVLLDYLEDDGQRIEPKYFCPILPLLLINGSQGIGTGWSTFIPQHSPVSVMDYIRRRLDNDLEQLSQIEPYARGFKGTIERQENGYASVGRVKVLDSKTLLIDELPIGVWTSSYKAFLLKLQSKGNIVDFREDHTTTKVSFKVFVRPSQLERMEKSGLEKSLKLRSSLPLTNMNAFDHDGKIMKFDTAESIANAYFPTRLSLYHDRKSVLMSQMDYTATMMRNKARFIQMVADGEVDLIGGKISKDETYALLNKFGFQTSSQLDEIKNNNSLRINLDDVSSTNEGLDGTVEYEDLIEEEESSDTKMTATSASFDYLLSMPLSSLTSERIDALTKEALKKESDLRSIRDTLPEELWVNDLDKLAPHL
jgi:DNA topoisomerase-2